MQNGAVLDFYFVRCDGEQAAIFLQGQLSCHIEEFPPSGVLLGTYNNIKGRMHAFFYLTKSANAYYLAIPYDSAVANHCLKTLKKYIIFFKASLHLENEWGTIGVLRAEPSFLETAKMHGCFVHQSFTEGTLIFGSARSIRILQDINTMKMNQSDWQRQEFIQRIPHITKDTIETFLPQHLNMISLGAIHFKKGCYLGQEIIARMYYKADIKKHLKYQHFSKDEVALEIGEVVNRLDEAYCTDMLLLV